MRYMLLVQYVDVWWCICVLLKGQHLCSLLVSGVRTEQTELHCVYYSRVYAKIY